MNPISNQTNNQNQQGQFQQDQSKSQYSARDYYETLGVDRNATDDDISRAYKHMSLRYHPDQYKTANQGERERNDVSFSHVSEAYQALSDRDRRVS